MSCFSNPRSTGSHCRVTGISDSSTMDGMPVAATLKVAIIIIVIMWMRSAAAHSASSDAKRLPNQR